MLSGKIRDSRAVLRRDDRDHLLLEWRGQSFNLAEDVVRHRDDEGLVDFSITTADGASATARYPRRGPRRRDRVWATIDFTADEPWTWEDRDFGLLVFHAATGTGPIKNRHRFKRNDPGAAQPRSLKLTACGLERAGGEGRIERARFENLVEIRAKFEASGIWAPASILVLAEHQDLVIFPLGSSQDVGDFRDRLLPHLRLLPGWGSDAESAAEDACEYAMRQGVGPTREEALSSRAERQIWSASSA